MATRKEHDGVVVATVCVCGLAGSVTGDDEGRRARSSARQEHVMSTKQVAPSRREQVEARTRRTRAWRCASEALGAIAVRKVRLLLPHAKIPYDAEPQRHPFFDASMSFDVPRPARPLLKDRMRASRLQELFSDTLWQGSDHGKHLAVVVPHPRLGIKIWRGQARHVAVVSQRRQARGALDVGVGRCGSRRSRAIWWFCRRRQRLFEDQLGQAARRLGEVRLQVWCGHGGGASWSRGAARGEPVVILQRGGRGAAVAPRGRNDRGFLARGIAEDGLDVLVAALVGTPVRVAEALMDRVDVELLDERLVRGLRGQDFWVRHFARLIGLFCV